MKRGIAASLLVTALGGSLLWFGTDGFAAFTSEAARRNAVSRQPRQVPAVLLEDQDGRLFRLRDYRNKLVAVEFIYTRCVTMCSALGAGFRLIRDNIPAAALGRDVVLVSISFDPLNDSPEQLKAYARRFGADGNGWRIARVRNQADLKTMLDTFGITVIPDGLGGFEHNAAIHLLDRSGRLTLIADYNEPLSFATHVRALL
jgi:protein SCO1/2